MEMAVTDFLCLQMKTIFRIIYFCMTETYILLYNSLSIRVSKYILQTEKVELLPFCGSWGKRYARFPN